jgi:hypothetical protein
MFKAGRIPNIRFQPIIKNFIFSEKITDFTDYIEYSVFFRINGRIFGFDRLFKILFFLEK